MTAIPAAKIASLSHDNGKRSLFARLEKERGKAEKKKEKGKQHLSGVKSARVKYKEVTTTTSSTGRVEGV